MKVNLTAYYSDGTSGIVTVEKPAGAYLDSLLTLYVGLCAAELTGKDVARIGRARCLNSTKGNPVFVEVDFPTRNQIINDMRKYGARHLKAAHK